MINKVIYGSTTLLDLTADTVTAEHLETGYTAHNANGAPITGTMPNRGSENGTISTKAEIYTIPEGYHNGSGSVSIDSSEQNKIIAENIRDGVSILGVTGSYSGSGSGESDTSDATASSSDILSGQTAYISSGKVTGTMVNNGTVSGTISTATGVYTVPQGYHSGSGSVAIDSAEQAKLIAENIKNGVSILGVTGSYAGSGGTDTSDATASAADILSGQTAYINSGKTTGTMTNNGAISGVISEKAESYTIPAGYHNGSGSMSIDSVEQAKIIPSNIKDGITILGVTGSYEGSGGTDTSDATATAADILSGQTAYVDSEKLTGTMPNRGSVSRLITTKTGIYTVAKGYHDGSGTVSIDSAEQAKILAANIRTGVSILGVTGTLGAFTLVEPIAYDFADGYVANATGWTYQANSNNRADVYQVTAGHTYFCRLGDTVGVRWRGCFTTANPVTATAKLTGSCVVYQNESNVPQRACFAYKPRVDGYITIVKTNTGVNGIPTYMYDITGFDLLLSLTAIATPTAITVTSNPIRTVYDSGELIDYSGLVVTASYSDGSTADVTSSCTFTPNAGKAFDPSTDTNVDIRHKGVITSLELTTATLTGISVTRNPSKTSYRFGEKADYTGMVVTATYSDGSTADVTSRCRCSPAQGELVSDTATITYTYGSNSKSCTLRLTVAACSLHVHNLPTKTTYTPGEDVDYSGAIIFMWWGQEDLQNVTDLCSYTPDVDGDRTIVTVSCAPPKAPDITDINSGYIQGSKWVYSSAYPDDKYDSYRVYAGHTYYLYAGATTQSDNGVYFNALFTATDVSQATSDVTGTLIVQDFVSENRKFTYTPASDGYITMNCAFAVTRLSCFLYDAENPNKIITTTFTLTTLQPEEV